MLIDFDNVSNWSLIFSDHAPIKEDVVLFMDNLLGQTLNVINELNLDIDEVWLRIYGGWHEKEVGPTDLYRLLESAKDLTPLRRSGKSIRVDIVRGLYGFSGVTFEESYSAKKGLGMIRRVQPNPCSSSPCTFWNAVKKRGKLCPDANCKNSASDLFYSVKQKTIDASICTDAVNIAQDDPNSWLVVFSSDYDIVPGILGATRHSNKIIRFSRADKPPKPFSCALLQQHGVMDKVINI
jgi:uncharacterized LabA/DUF88 family protein